ncbi:hypothetical protein WDW86_03760, partial [Bdellovibrionota bacterium FG-2]
MPPKFFALLGLLILTLLSTQTPAATKYPAHWWKEAKKETAPAWEVLPQEARPGEVILSKRHELGLLSNFAPTAFIFRVPPPGSENPSPLGDRCLMLGECRTTKKEVIRPGIVNTIWC